MINDLVALSELPKIVREHLRIAPDASDKSELTRTLTRLISEFFDAHSLELEPVEVSESYNDLPEWRIDTVLAKLRSLVERRARGATRTFVAQLEKKERDQASKLLRHAGLYNFREMLELDLYVGVHTAISAYFKMAGLALSKVSDTELPLEESAKELFKTLKFIASLPLRYLMAVDGLFWDSKQYFIPKFFEVQCDGAHAQFFLPRSVIMDRISIVEADEIATGCPALRARISNGAAIFEKVEDLCLRTIRRYFLEFRSITESAIDKG